MSTIPVTFKPPWMYFNNLPERARIRALAIAQALPGATSAVVVLTLDFEILGCLRTIRQHIIEPVLPGPELHWVQYTMSEQDPCFALATLYLYSLGSKVHSTVDYYIYVDYEIDGGLRRMRQHIYDPVLHELVFHCGRQHTAPGQKQRLVKKLHLIQSQYRSKSQHRWRTQPSLHAGPWLRPEGSGERAETSKVGSEIHT
ncbi:hypothetical protein PG989_015129 [Apiospora arundinis]